MCSWKRALTMKLCLQFSASNSIDRDALRNHALLGYDGLLLNTRFATCWDPENSCRSSNVHSFGLWPQIHDRLRIVMENGMRQLSLYLPLDSNGIWRQQNESPGKRAEVISYVANLDISYSHLEVPPWEFPVPSMLSQYSKRCH
jgi:hypothetical protein